MLFDPSMDELLWSMYTDVSFLNINPETGNLSGTPTTDDIGFRWVLLYLTDENGGRDKINLTFVVRNRFVDIEISTFHVTDLYEDTPFFLDFDVIYNDLLFDNILWSMETDASFLILDLISGNLSGIPTNDDVGTWWVLINVSDGNGGFDEVNLSLEVLNVNDDPEILPIEINNLYEDSLFFIDMDAIDIDPTNDTLVWSLRTNSSFIIIDPITGNLSGFPTNEDMGTFWANISVSDGNDGFGWRNISITVLNVNDAPTLNITGCCKLQYGK